MAVLQGSSYPAEMDSGADLTGSTVTLTVTAPDGTTSTPTVTVAGTAATATIPATQVGTYLLVWAVTGGLAGMIQDQFTVEAASLYLLSVSDLRDELNLTAGGPKDAELQRWLRNATAVVENVTGPIMAKTRVDVFNGGGEFVILPFRWVQSIQSVIETIAMTNFTITEQPLGFSVDQYGYTWDRNTNRIVRRAYGGGPYNFTPGIDSVAVTYTLGMQVVPGAIQQAAARMIDHWYRKTNSPFRGGSFMGNQGDDAGTTIVGNYEIPNAAMELLEPYRRRPGIF